MYYLYTSLVLLCAFYFKIPDILIFLSWLMNLVMFTYWILVYRSLNLCGQVWIYTLNRIFIFKIIDPGLLNTLFDFNWRFFYSVVIYGWVIHTINIDFLIFIIIFKLGGHITTLYLTLPGLLMTLINLHIAYSQAEAISALFYMISNTKFLSHDSLVTRRLSNA